MIPILSASGFNLSPTTSSVLIDISIGVAAFLLGVGITWILMRQRKELAVRECESAMNAQIAVLSQSLATAQEKNTRIPELELEAGTAAREIQTLREQQARSASRVSVVEAQLAEERKATTEKLAVLGEAQTRFSDAFKALSAEALRHNNTSFLELAKSTLEKTQEGAKGDLEKRQEAIDALVRPMRESLEKVDAKINDLEKARTGAYEALTTQVRSLAETQNYLRSETSNLVRALRSPIVRGRWGEIQLRRVVELAGMIDHCDFVEQTSVQTEEGRLRPDMIVRLPGGKNIVVDAKASLNAYLEALEAHDDASRAAAWNSTRCRCGRTSSSFRASHIGSSSRARPISSSCFCRAKSFLARRSSVTHVDRIRCGKNIILATPTSPHPASPGGLLWLEGGAPRAERAGNQPTRERVI